VSPYIASDRIPGRISPFGSLPRLELPRFGRVNAKSSLIPGRLSHTVAFRPRSNARAGSGRSRLCWTGNYRKGPKNMDQDVIYKAQILPIAHDPFCHVTTYLLCGNTLLRTGVAQLLAGSHFALSGDASTGVPDLSVTDDNPPTLILICESLSPEGYVELLGELKERCPGARLVLLADHLAPEAIGQLVGAGLNGLCSTGMSQQAMIKALELVMLRETFLPASIGFALFDRVSAQQPKMMLISGDPAAANRFSERERQILRLLTTGASNKLIARELGLAEATVKVHLKAVLKKIRAENRTQAAMWATQYLSLEPDSQGLRLVG
jgi:two-component system, NarL family, nitrate/nitrite response regulator NarL